MIGYIEMKKNRKLTEFEDIKDYVVDNYIKPVEKVKKKNDKQY